MSGFDTILKVIGAIGFRLDGGCSPLTDTVSTNHT